MPRFPGRTILNRGGPQAKGVTRSRAWSVPWTTDLDWMAHHPITPRSQSRRSPVSPPTTSSPGGRSRHAKSLRATPERVRTQLIVLRNRFPRALRAAPQPRAPSGVARPPRAPSRSALHRASSRIPRSRCSTRGRICSVYWSLGPRGPKDGFKSFPGTKPKTPGARGFRLGLLVERAGWLREPLRESPDKEPRAREKIAATNLCS